MSLRNRLVFSSDANHDYAFYLPLASLTARLRGLSPLVLLVGTAERWMATPRLRIPLERARAVGAECVFLGDFPDVRTSTVAQVARIFAAAVPGVAEDDVLMTSDADMLIVGAWPGGTPRMRPDALQLYGGNAYEGEAQLHFPMCYQRATAATWRELTTSAGYSLRGAIESALIACPSDSTGAWNFDERHFGGLVAEWPGYPDRCQIIRRDFRQGQWRLDRSDWNVDAFRAQPENFSDLHCPRPGYSDAHWPGLSHVLSRVLGDRWLRWAMTYREEYVGAAVNS